MQTMPTAHDEMIRLSDQLGQVSRRNAELEAELRAVLKWAKRMGYTDLTERLRRLLGAGG